VVRWYGRKHVIHNSFWAAQLSRPVVTVVIEGLVVASATLPLLDMQNISKRFGSVIALDHVSFAAQRGEIHALIGQNGAGKSTLMKILAGAYSPESGNILLDNAPVHFTHPRDALRHGIGVVYQDLSLVPKLGVAENIFLGREPGGRFFIHQNEILERAKTILARLGVGSIRVQARVESLPLAQQQLVEIAKVLAYEPRILVLDEPTAALAQEETDLLFDILHGLRKQGIAIIYISHRFKEILQHCDRATVLRNGQVIKTMSLAGVSEDELIEFTIGEKIEQFFHTARGSAQDSQAKSVALEVENLSVGREVCSISFSLNRGEIVGITGLLGAGQNALARALFGIMPEVSGIIRVKGKPVLITSPTQAVRLGIGLLTEHRKTEGLVLEMNVRENITLPSLRRFRLALLFNANRAEVQMAQKYTDQLHIKTPSIGTKVTTLSGGNQQKVILARWLLRDLDVLIFISPTQGIDVGAKAEIYEELRELAAAGKSILAVSEELVEILGISDRIIVMDRGRIGQIFDRADATEEAIMSVMQGNREAAS
jgi:ribose transport system ATP-binding protein